MSTQLDYDQSNLNTGNIRDINFDNFQTDSAKGHYRGEQDVFDKGLSSLLYKDQKIPNMKNRSFDSPVRVSMSFGVEPQQPTPVEETVSQLDTASVIVDALVQIRGTQFNGTA